MFLRKTKRWNMWNLSKRFSLQLNFVQILISRFHYFKNVKSNSHFPSAYFSSDFLYIRKYFKNKVFNTIIPRLVRLVEAPSHGIPISDYDPVSRATLAYQNLAKEVISRNGD